MTSLLEPCKETTASLEGALNRIQRWFAWWFWRPFSIIVSTVKKSGFTQAWKRERERERRRRRRRRRRRGESEREKEGVC